MERLFQKKTVYQLVTLEYLTLDILILKETGTTEGSPHLWSKTGTLSLVGQLLVMGKCIPE